MKTSEILQSAKATVTKLRACSTAEIDRGLQAMADCILKNELNILRQNEIDLEYARATMREVMLDRLRLDSGRIAGMAEGIRAVAKLPSPVGEVMEEILRPNGLRIRKVRVPMGVIAIIYESRPNVTSDAAALSLKSGNVCVLRGGKEAYHSARAICDALREGLREAGLPEDAVQLVDDTSRESARELMTAKGYVDLLIPRGGAGLIRACVENATVPCMETGTGICHIYVDRAADFNMALSILENAKASRPSVCNAAEVCLVHREIAADFLPVLVRRFGGERLARGLTPVALHGDAEACRLAEMTPMAASDFDTEFLDYTMAVGIVGSVGEAVAHIAAHSTAHSESIITADTATAEYFLSHVDSAAVYWNASTRFTDGGEFGLGCEMGISTQKMHARGPLGLRELTTYQYRIYGNGQIR